MKTTFDKITGEVSYEELDAVPNEKEVESMYSQRRTGKEVQVVFEEDDGVERTEQEVRYSFRDLLMLGWKELVRVVSEVSRKRNVRDEV